MAEKNQLAAAGLRLTSCACVLLQVACSDGAPNVRASAFEPNHPNDSTIDASVGEATPLSRFHVAIDYRFDDRALFSADRRVPLEAAARYWEALIASDFAPVPAATTLRVRRPEDMTAPGVEFTLDYTIDDLAILVGFSLLDGPGQKLAISGSSFTPNIDDATLLEALDRRYHGRPFQPWIASIGFDDAENWFYDPTPETRSDIPPAQADFMSTALHEIGHALGIGNSAAWDSLVSDNHFVGAQAVRVFGGPIPLTPDHAHVAKGVLVDEDRPLMDSSTPLGTRKYPTRLELAFLEDLGYAVLGSLDLPEP